MKPSNKDCGKQCPGANPPVVENFTGLLLTYIYAYTHTPTPPINVIFGSHTSLSLQRKALLCSSLEISSFNPCYSQCTGLIRSSFFIFQSYLCTRCEQEKRRLLPFLLVPSRNVVERFCQPGKCYKVLAT